MKKYQRSVLLIVLFVYPGISDIAGQNYSLAGVWRIQKVDSCTRIVYPGATVYKYPLQNISGTITFTTNGTGIIKSNTQILCKNSDFNWIQRGDSLILSVNSHASEFQAYSKVIFQNENKVELKKVFGCGRFGLAIWYDLVLEKKE